MMQQPSRSRDEHLPDCDDEAYGECCWCEIRIRVADYALAQRGVCDNRVCEVSPYAKAESRDTLRKSLNSHIWTWGGAQVATVSGYDAFISYAVINTIGHLVPLCRPALERVCEAVAQAADVKDLIDKADLAASPELWGSVEAGLASSRWFILLALSGRSGGLRSAWTPREVRWWRGAPDLWLIHAAICCSRYSSWTCCGVRYWSPECRRRELYQNSMYLTTSRYACSRVGYSVR